jgi:hypothetical protein
VQFWCQNCLKAQTTDFNTYELSFVKIIVP